MLSIEDLKRQIVKKMRGVGFNFGAFNEKSEIKFPFCNMSVVNDIRDDCKERSFNTITINVEIIAKGFDELKSLINDLQQSAMTALEGDYTGEEHWIEFIDMDDVQYIEEEDENYNIFRRVIPCRFLIQTDKF